MKKTNYGYSLPHDFVAMLLVPYMFKEHTYTHVAASAVKR